jgi:hypothetical protein
MVPASSTLAFGRSTSQLGEPLQAVGVQDGYARHAVRPDFDQDGPAGEVPGAPAGRRDSRRAAQLWAYLLDH